MKKVLVTLVMALFVVSGFAQTREASNALKALEKAKSETENPKKGALAATWVKLGNAYVSCFDAPLTGIWQGASQMEVHLLLKDQPVLAQNTVEEGGTTFNVESYSDKDLYYDESGVLMAWVVKKPVVEEDALAMAMSAFDKAYELDEGKNTQTKALTEALSGIQTRYVNEGMANYSRGNNTVASDFFGKAVEVSQHPLVNNIDSVMVYYTAITAAIAGDDARAIEYLKKCIEINFAENGDVYAYLADCYKRTKDTTTAMQVLNDGFAKYPLNQGILVALINMYMESGDEPTKLFELLKTAQENEPTNASLYYAEGNVHLNLKDFESAIAAYKKACEIDANYFWGWFSTGKTYYDMAVAIQEKANMEMDDAKYMAMLEELDAALVDAIDPLEKSFTLTEDPELKAYVAEILKNIYFRFRDKSADNMANYEKYNNYLNGNE